MCCSQHLVPKREIPVTCNLSFYFPARSGTSLQCKSQLDKVTHLDLQEKKKKRKYTEYMHSICLQPSSQTAFLGQSSLRSGSRGAFEDRSQLS